MSAPTQNVTLDLSRIGALPPRVYLGSGDRNGTVLKAIITDDGAPFDCDGLTPYLVVPLDTTVKWQGTASGNVATIPIDESALGDFVGKVGNAYVSLESDEMATSTQRLTVVVLEGASEDAADDPTTDAQGDADVSGPDAQEEPGDSAPDSQDVADETSPDSQDANDDTASDLEDGNGITTEP